MEGRRLRRFRRRQRTSSLLPVDATAVNNITNTVSCWYCDFKLCVLNEALYRFGRRYARWLKLWFSIGVGFSLALVLGVTVVLVWILFHRRSSNDTAFFVFFFGFSPSVSFPGAAYLFLATLVSVSLHEFGHAVAATSEGLQVEYIAVFIAILFPGALVAFNYDLLQALPRFTALRIYCAGIWHNAALCAVCGLSLFILPVILHPFYIHGEGLMVLDVSSESPLLSYLSPGDVIVSLDGISIQNEQDWMEMTAFLNKQTLQDSKSSKYAGLGAVDNRKEYCVPNLIIEESKKVQLMGNLSGCPHDFTAFVTAECYYTSISDNISSVDVQPNKRESAHCMNAKDVVKLNRCIYGQVATSTNRSGCQCAEDESCLCPVQLPDSVWVEISYSRPYSLECLQTGSSKNFSAADFLGHDCGGTFIFVGDVISMSHSVQLTSYQPRWPSTFVACFPHVLERSLICIFYVSLTLALLNSLPVYLLDGESILEATLCYFTSFSSRKREKILQISLLGGTLISVFSFLKMFFINFF